MTTSCRLHAQPPSRSRRTCGPIAGGCCGGSRRRCEREGHMSLADRLAQARRSRDAGAGATTQNLDSHSSNGRRTADPFLHLKRTVHTTLLDNLGPQLYDTRFTQADLEQKVRHTLQGVLAQEETPLSVADRTRIAQELSLIHI